MLVEGPAELFLIPALVRVVKGIDLDREGVSVIPIYGVHFDVYAKLFCAECLPKRCAIVADGDLIPGDAIPPDQSADKGEDELLAAPDMVSLEGDYVRVFTNRTTFERAVTLPGTLPMLAAACDDVGATTVAIRLRAGLAALKKPGLSNDDRIVILEPLRKSVLNTAQRFGKARFAQIAARHADKATSLPAYITTAVNWLIET